MAIYPSGSMPCPIARYTSSVEVSDQVRIGSPDEFSATGGAGAKSTCLDSWRKGPFQVFGTYIDTEWRSDWKWQRAQDQPLWLGVLY